MCTFVPMKIAVLTSGILPIPAVKGGAVENLIDFYLEYNEVKKLHDITVYSVADEDTKQHPALRSEVNHYHYIETRSLLAKVRKHLFKALHGELYYHYTIAWYLDQALKDIGRKDYDLIIIENRPGYAPEVARRTKCPIAIHLHNDFLNKDTKDGPQIYDAVSRVVTVSDYIQNRVRTLSADDTKAVTVYNGIDLTAFSPTATTISRERLGLKTDDFVLVYSGRINPEKGIAQLVKAQLLLAEHHDIKLLVMGSNFFADRTTDDPFTQQLKADAEKLGDRILFTGFIPYHELPGYLQLADVAVIPSQWDEPFGLTCVEAMAMGKPIIATQKGGIPEILDAEDAILLPTGVDFEQRLAENILMLKEQSERRTAMGAHAMKASQRFSKSHYAQSFFEALKF